MHGKLLSKILTVASIKAKMERERVLDPRVGEDQKKIVKTAIPNELGYMMATTAHHQLGDMSAFSPQLCYVTGETDWYYVGNWVEGFPFFNILFPKSTTRELTELEKENIK